MPEKTGETIIRGRVRIDWDELGEGTSGDYDDTDPNDVELLRFTVYRFEGDDALLAAANADPQLEAMLSMEGRGWSQVDDASYCTTVAVSTDTAERQRLLEELMEEFHGPVTCGHNVKKLGEALSWIGSGR